MKTISILVLAAMSAFGATQIVKSGGGYLMRMQFKPGTTYKFRVLSTVGGAGANTQGMKFSLPMIWKVAGVKNKIATIDTTVGPISMGKDVLAQATKNRIQLDSRGRLIGNAGSGQQVTPSLPEKPIKVGQTWTASAPIEVPGQGSKKVTATYTFKGIKNVGGKSAAELGIKTSGQAAGTGTMFLLLSDGSLLKSTMNLNLAMTGPNGAASSYRVTAAISRQ